MCGHWGKCELDGDQILLKKQTKKNVQLIISPLHQKTWCWETFFTVSVSQPTHRAPVLLFLYLIVITCWLTISMTTSISADILMRSECVGLFFFLSHSHSLTLAWKPLHSCLTAPNRGNLMLCVSVKSPWEVEPDPRSAFISLLSSSPAVIHSHPLCHYRYELQITKACDWLWSPGSSRCVWSCVVCCHYISHGHLMSEFLEFQLEHQHVTSGVVVPW